MVFGLLFFFSRQEAWDGEEGCWDMILRVGYVVLWVRKILGLRIPLTFGMTGGQAEDILQLSHSKSKSRKLVHACNTRVILKSSPNPQSTTKDLSPVNERGIS